MQDQATVTSADGTTHVVTLTITGTNDVPVVSGDTTGSVTEDADPLTLTATGQLVISDIDTGESSFAAGTYTGTYGSITMDAAGNGTYSADNTQTAIQELTEGATLTDVITVTTFDGTTQDITITINGTNDPTIAISEEPVIAVPGQTINIDVLANDSDVDNVTLAVTGIVDPADPGNVLAISVGNPVTLVSGTVVTLLGDGTLDVTPGSAGRCRKLCLRSNRQRWRHGAGNRDA
jgi:VCBS repeat-containing protein